MSMKKRNSPFRKNTPFKDEIYHYGSIRPFDQYLNEIAAFNVFSREGEQDQYVKIDESEYRLLNHILIHPNAKAIVMELLNLLQEENDETVKDDIQNIFDLLNTKQLNVSEIARNLVPKSRFSDTMREWLDEICVKIKIMGIRSNPDWIQELESLNADRIKARTDFFLANLRLVVLIAKKCMKFTTSLSLPDLVQEGNIGLLRAVARFDPSRGNRFSTYSVWWIRHHVNRAVQDLDKPIRIPVHMIDDMIKMNKVEREHKARTGEFLDRREMAERLDLPASRIKSLEEVRRMRVSSFEVESNDNDDSQYSLLEVLEEEDCDSPFDSMLKKKISTDVRNVLKVLPERDAQVLKWRYGIDSEEYTLQEIASKWGLSRERIRQIEFEAMKRLKEYCKDLKDHIDGNIRKKGSRMSMESR